MRLLAFIFLLLLKDPVVAQAGHLSVSEIDSLVSIIDTSKELRIAITDGTIQPKGKRKPKGGYSDTYFLNPENKISKVVYEVSLFTYDFTTFYFYGDSLILTKTTSRNIKDYEEVLFRGRYYFDNGFLLDKEEVGKPLRKPEAFLSQARLYLNDYDSIFNR